MDCAATVATMKTLKNIPLSARKTSSEAPPPSVSAMPAVAAAQSSALPMRVRLMSSRSITTLPSGRQKSVTM